MYGGAGNASPANTVKGSPSAGNTFFGNQDGFAMKSPFHRGMFFMMGQRRRLNIVAILISLFVPWLLFCFVYAILAFELHYKLPMLAYLLILLAFVCVVGSSAFFAASVIKKKYTDPAYTPSWYIFIAITSILAFGVALAFGEWDYIGNMQPYYNLSNLASYKDIDTNVYLGQQLMDAGSIEFKKGTALDLSRSMGFKNDDIYCVAPIVTKGSVQKPLSVDFWAVGKNCCSGVAADFHCSGFSDPHATGVIRQMHNEDRPFYRLAVQQAEATYHMTASHPLFFEWVHNAEEATTSFAHRGYQNFVVGIFAYFLVQAFLTAAIALAFSKLMHL